MYSIKKDVLKKLGPEDIFTKYKMFDYELYINNYCLRENGGYDDKIKAWTHYLLYCDDQDLIYFDVTSKGKYETMKANFDFDLYIDNYNLKENGGYDTFNKAWWHYVNIGQKNKYIYFDIKKREEYEIQRTNFDDVKYINSYFFLKKINYNTPDKLWWHYLNIGKKGGLFYFDKRENKKIVTSYKKNILYCIPTPIPYDKNKIYDIEIQEFVKNIGNIIETYFLDYNLFLVTFDEEKQDLCLINSNESNTSFEDKYNLFINIKNNKNTILFVPEIPSPNTYLILDIILKKMKFLGIKTVSSYYNDNIYNNIELDELYRTSIFDEYITIVSKFDIIMTIYKNGENNYMHYHNRLNIQKKQTIKELQSFDNIQLKNISFNSLYNCTREILETIENTIDYNIQNTFIKPNNEKVIYYYVEHTCKIDIRTGVQVTTIYLAKQFIKNITYFNFQIIFIKWCNTKMALIPCNKDELNYLFNFGEKDDFIDDIVYNDYSPIHLNTKIPIDKCIFFCPEVIIYDTEIITNLPEYLNKHNIKNVFLVYDIIPLVLESYHNFLSKEFELYIHTFLLNSNKLISISNFTKIEFINYCNKNDTTNNVLSNINIKSILLPFQYRNKSVILDNNNDNDKIIILVPGTIEERKQQLVLFEQFIKFIEKYPDVNVEMIAFGHNWYTPEKMNEVIAKSDNKITYLGIIDNETLFDLYNKANFSCFVSYYEGFGFPIVESLWHKTPVLTANFGSMNEIAEISGGCYTINTKNKEDIYNGLEELILNPKLLEKLRSEIIVTNFPTWFDYAEKIYQALIPLF